MAVDGDDGARGVNLTLHDLRIRLRAHEDRLGNEDSTAVARVESERGNSDGMPCTADTRYRSM